MNTETLQYAKLILIGRSSLIKKANNKMHQETKEDMETPRNWVLVTRKKSHFFRMDEQLDW